MHYGPRGAPRRAGRNDAGMKRGTLAILLALSAACTGGDAAPEVVCTYFPAMTPPGFEIPGIRGPFDMGMGMGGMGMGMPRVTGQASAKIRGYIRDIARVLGVAEVPIYQGSV